MTSSSEGKTASLHRLATPNHLCPYGLKTKSFLERQGFTVDDHLLTTREQVIASWKSMA